MTVEVNLGHAICNTECFYCYQTPIREAGNVLEEYDLEAIKESVKKYDEQFNLSGGEVLVNEKDKLEELFEFAHEEFGGCSLQTNGSLIDSDHVEMFKEYNVSVGVSIDGPGELNDFRWAGSEEKTRELTEKTLESIETLAGDEDISLGIITTVHRKNAGDDEKLEKLKDFVLWLADLGVTNGNMHMLEATPEVTGDIREKCSLDPERNRDVFLELARFLEGYPGVNWKPFSDIKKRLKVGSDDVTCIWRACDPWSTDALIGIEADGRVTPCPRGDVEGVDPLRVDKKNYSRYLALYHTPQERGGCKGCRFYALCLGHCPGSSIDKDTQNRSEHCPAVKALFNFYEKMIDHDEATGKPVSKMSNISEVERLMVEGFRNNQRVSLGQALEKLRRSGSGERESNQMTESSSKSDRGGGSMDHDDGIKHVDGGYVHEDGMGRELDQEEIEDLEDHGDGIKHVDGAHMHMDSEQGEAEDDPGRAHDDGITHIDGQMVHEDGVPGPDGNEISDEGDHDDGIQHVDGEHVHLDSASGSSGGGDEEQSGSPAGDAGGQSGAGSHDDGIEHGDGGYRHLDSDQADHGDGIKHVDGGSIHNDGMQEGDEWMPQDQHTDGIQHMDEGNLHLDTALPDEDAAPEISEEMDPDWSPGEDHDDGIKHEDGQMMHLDSGPGDTGDETEQDQNLNHDDDITHVDGGVVHDDGIPQDESSMDWTPGKNHSDGIQHVDGEHMHLDSGPAEGAGADPGEQFETEEEFEEDHTDDIKHTDGGDLHFDSSG